MTQVVQFALLGVGTGALYALLAQGVVLIFRGSGVLNLAHGAIAMIAAYLFNTLHVNHAWPLAPALVVSIGAAAALGLATDQVLLRRLRRSSALSRLIATLGVLVVLESVGVIVWGATPILVLPFITPHPVHLLGTTITSDRLWLLAIAIALTALLSFVWRFTRAGWVTTAVAENERAAAAIGCSPRLVSALTWASGAALAGLAGILISPITQLSVTTLTLLVVPSLAAALVGGFSSYTATLVAGLLIGVGQAELGNYVQLTGASDALPFAVIIVVLVVRGSALPLRSHVFDRLSDVGKGRLGARACVALTASGLIACAVITSDNWLGAISQMFAVAIVLLSLVVLTGYAGQVSLCQYALAGIGALTAARLAATQHWPFELSVVAGVLAASLVGLLFALPALRTRGVNLAVVTLGLGLAVNSMLFNNGNVTGGISGTTVGAQRLFGWNIDPATHPGRYATVTLVGFAICGLLVAKLRQSRYGRRLLAVRANERAAAATGVGHFGCKLYAFAISGALAGLGGILIGFASTTVTFDGFDPITSLSAVAQVVIGGVGFIAATVFPGALLAPASIGSVVALHWQALDNYLPLAGGVGLLLALVVAPNGIVAKCLSLRRRSTRALLHDATPAPPTAPGLPARSCLPRTLRVRGLRVRYAGVQAVAGVDLDVRPGEVVGLIGPNGAGKTSLMDAVTGFTPYLGQVLLDDIAIDSWSPQRRAHAGLVRTFQGLELFDQMTVLENLLVAAEHDTPLPALRDLAPTRSEELPAVAAAVIHNFNLASVLDRKPGELSYGERRRVSVARAMAMDPSILLLDEPVAGLDEQESLEFIRLVRDLAASTGVAILLVEHDMDFVNGVCDRVLVVNFGKPIFEGLPSQLIEDEQVIAAYLGTEAGVGSEANRSQSAAYRSGT